MIKDEQRVNFLKNRILSRLETMQEYMSGTKYRLYRAMINDCNSFDEIREIAELDMQLGLIDYVRDIKGKLDENNISVEDIESINNSNAKAIRMSIITPSKNIHKVAAADIDISTLGEDMEDEEVLASAANLLFSRLNSMPPEELYREQLEEAEDEFDTSDEAIENIDVSEEEMYYDGDDEEETDDIELDIEDEEEDNFFQDDEDSEEEEGNAAEDVIDFGTNDNEDIDNIDDADLFEEDSEEDSENSEEDDFDIDDSELFIDEEDEESEDEDGFDIDNIDDSDLFVEDDEEGEESDEDETDWDSLGDDLFSEEDEESEDDEESDETDWDSLGDDLYDDSEYDEDDSEDEDSSMDDLDNIDADDLFGDDEDESEEDEEADDPMSDIDNLDFEDSDDFDIDESEFEYEEPEDEADSFDDFFNSTDVNEVRKQPAKRELTPQKVFINGSKRGKQTQDMFNMLNGIFNAFGKAGSTTGKAVKKSVQAGARKVNNSQFFNLSNQ